MASSFLAYDPGFEAQRRQLSDQLAATLASLGVAESQIPQMVNLLTSRLDTDQGYATSALRSNLADRGVFDSTFTPFLQQRDIDIPYSRQRQDIGIDAARSLADIATQRGEAQLGYNQGLTEAYADLAARQSGNTVFAGRGRRRRGRPNLRLGRNRPGRRR